MQHMLSDELPTLRLRTLRRLLAGRPIVALHHAMPVAVARALFREARVPIAAVVDEGGDTLCGTIAWRDLRRVDDGERSLGEVMEHDYVTVAAESDLDAALAMMTEHGVDHVIVVGVDGELVGILDAHDLSP